MIPFLRAQKQAWSVQGESEATVERLPLLFFYESSIESTFLPPRTDSTDPIPTGMNAVCSC